MTRGGFNRRDFLKYTGIGPIATTSIPELETASSNNTQVDSSFTGPSKSISISPGDDLTLISGIEITVNVSIELESDPLTWGDSLSEGDAEFTIELSGFEYLESDVDGPFTVTPTGSNSFNVKNTKDIEAPAQHAVAFFLEPTADDQAVVEVKGEDHPPVTYDIETDPKPSWDYYADIADRRIRLFENYIEAYDGVVGGDSWEEQFAEETADILTKLAVDKTQSIATAGITDLADKEWLKVATQAYGLRSGLTNTTIGRAIKSSFDLAHDLIDHSHQNAIDCAGKSDDVLEELGELCEDEKDAWQSQNREELITLLENQRSKLFDTSIGAESLYLEARFQQNYRSNWGRTCEGFAFGGDTKNEVREFFQMLMDFARDEEQNVADTLRFVRPPNPSVSTSRRPEEISAELRDLATEEQNQVEVDFEVLNSSGAGLSSIEGYLSVSYSEYLSVTVESDDEIDTVIHSPDDGSTIIDREGNEITPEYPLLDVFGQYEPGDTRVITVVFEAVETEEVEEFNEEDVWFQYRSALQPLLTAEEPGTAAGQAEFERAPDPDAGNGFEEDQQGWPARHITAEDAAYPPTASFTVEPSQVAVDEEITLDASESTAEGAIETYSWDVDTTDNGGFDESYEGETVSISFSESGRKRIRLTVEDTNAETQPVSDTAEITVDPAPPDIVADYTTRPTTPGVGDKVSFISTVDADSYEWEIDGDQYTGETVTETLSSSGEYEVSLVVEQAGDSDEIVSQLTVENVEERLSSPRARIDGPVSLEVGEEGTFDASDSYHPNDELSIDSYEWEIDNSSFEGETVTYPFETEGSYSVELTVVTETEEDEVVDSATTTVAVGDDPEPPRDDPDSPAIIYFGDRDHVGTLYAVDIETEELEWDFTTVATFGHFSSSPTVVDGTLFIGGLEQFGLSISGSVYALDAETGDQKWRFAIGGQVDSSPTVVDGTLFVGSNDNYVYALDIETGDELWAFETADSVISSPTVVDDTLFVGSRDGNVYALDAETGDELWAFEAGGTINSSPTVVDGTLFIGSHDNNVYALDAETGDKRWIFETEGAINSSPTVVGGTLFIGSNDDYVYTLDAESGSKKWRIKTGNSILSSPTVVDGTLFVGSNDNNVYALDVETGDEQWHFETSDSITWSSPTVADGTLFIGNADGNVYVLDAETGDEQWHFETGADHFRASPTVVGDPEDGDSIGSRVNLGTRGHHHVWADEQSGTIDRDTGTVTGIVTDSDGDPLEAIEIEIIDSETDDLKTTATTDADGEYSVEIPAEKTYEFVIKEAELERFDTELTVEFGKNTLDVSLERDSLPPIVGDNSPQDLNRDGLYEDINGDGTADIVDVQALQQNLDTDAVQEHSKAFNFAGDDPEEVTQADVAALYDRVTGGDSDE